MGSECLCNGQRGHGAELKVWRAPRVCYVFGRFRQRTKDTLTRGHAITEHTDALEQHLAFLLSHPSGTRGLGQLAQPGEHILRLVGTGGEGGKLLCHKQRFESSLVALTAEVGLDDDRKDSDERKHRQCLTGVRGRGMASATTVGRHTRVGERAPAAGS